MSPSKRKTAKNRKRNGNKLIVGSLCSVEQFKNRRRTSVFPNFWHATVLQMSPSERLKSACDLLVARELRSQLKFFVPVSEFPVWVEFSDPDTHTVDWGKSAWMYVVSVPRLGGGLFCMEKVDYTLLKNVITSET